MFDKLTSPSSFTGAHRERFNEEGRGRGIEGRRGGDIVSDISSELRQGQRGGTTLASAHADRSRLMHGGSISPSKAGPGFAEARHAAAAAAAAVADSQAAAAANTTDGAMPGFSGKASQLQSILATMPSYSNAMGEADVAVQRLRHGHSSRAVAAANPRVFISSVELESVFRAYCAFGTTTRLPNELDSARFAKMCRENGIIDGRAVTGAGVDLAFSKAKQAKKRTLSYSDFQQALAILAPQRLPELDIVTALQTLVEKIIASGGPSVSSVSVPDIAPTSIFAKLTDGSLYTGTHRNRFGEDGVGLGKEGRE